MAVCIILYSNETTYDPFILYVEIIIIVLYSKHTTGQQCYSSIQSQSHVNSVPNVLVFKQIKLQRLLQTVVNKVTHSLANLVSPILQ